MRVCVLTVRTLTTYSQRFQDMDIRLFGWYMARLFIIISSPKPSTFTFPSTIYTK